MKRLDNVITSFGFNIEESITDKAKLYVNDSSIAFDIRHEREHDVYVGLGGRYFKVGKVISKIIRGSEKFIPSLIVLIDNPKLLTRNNWWDSM